MAIKGLFIPGITENMFRNASLESIETLISEGEVYDAELEMMIISEGKLVTARPEVDLEQIKAYCRSRCLSLVSNEYLEELRSVKLPERQWIPCYARLPDKIDHKEDMVLVCYENGAIRFNAYRNGWVQGDPVAWMPLPEPYKGGDEE